MASRLKHILPYLIRENQGSFIKGRKIWDNIILVKEAIHSSLKNDDKGMVVKLDLENSFDLSHPPFSLPGNEEIQIHYIIYLLGQGLHQQALDSSASKPKSFPLLPRFKRFEARMPTIPTTIHHPGFISKFLTGFC